MGKGALIAAAAVTALALIFMSNTQLISRETDNSQLNYQTGEMARELAMKAHKLIVAGWIADKGAGTPPFGLNNPVSDDGGTYALEEYNLSSGILDFRVRGIYDGTVHDVRSRYQWHGFGVKALQFKGVSTDLIVSPTAQFDFKNLAVDDLAINELEMMLKDLEHPYDLDDYDLEVEDLMDDIEDAFSNAGHNMTAELIDQAQRDALGTQNGMFFPDQVLQAVDSYVASNPTSQTIISDPTGIPSSFGGGGDMVLRLEGDVSLSSGQELRGAGILIVEGNLVVASGATLGWDGIVLVKPPDGTLNPQVDFSGDVAINGSFIAIHESLPNTGHMDVTTYRDYFGSWFNPYGAENKLSHWLWCLYHRHDFTTAYGNSIVYHSNVAGERIHESEVYLFETLSTLNPTDQIFFEILNPMKHGRGIITLGINGFPQSAYPVEAGFDPSIAAPGNKYRTIPFNVSDLSYFRTDITRLSSLNKMWDDSTSAYPNCTAPNPYSGPQCVSYDANRRGSLAFRLYKIQSGTETRVYEASMYWHKRADEEEEFQDEMQELINQIGSDDFGLDINLGDNTRITTNDDVKYLLNAVGGGAITVQNLGTWHKHWEPYDPDNPLLP